MSPKRRVRFWYRLMCVFYGGVPDRPNVPRLHAVFAERGRRAIADAEGRPR